MHASASRPGSLPALRATNTRRVVEVLQTSGGMTQADLARRTGLSAASVSGIVKDLVRDGVASTRREERDGRRGRVVRLSQDSRPPAVGVDLGRSHVRVLVGTGAEDISVETCHDLAATDQPDRVLEMVARRIRRACDEAEVELAELRGVSAAVAWPVLDDHGRLPRGGGGSAWADVRVGDRLGELLGRHVDVGNDADMGAVAVGHDRRPTDSAIFVKVGSGVGAGIFHRGEVIRGRTGHAGNLGHLIVDGRLATVCQCGRRGCLETVASIEAIRRNLSAALGYPVDVPRVFELLGQADPVASRVFWEAGEFIGQALGWLVTILDPELIVLGGQGAAAGDALLAPTRRGLEASVTSSVRDIPVELAPFGQRTEATGALLHALARVDTPV